MIAAPSGRIVPVQALRLIAALTVVVSHAEIYAYWLGRQLDADLPRLAWNGIGAIGVDLFFVISGFVMVYSSAGRYGTPHARRTFTMRRLIRIVPLYWLATLTLAAWLVFAQVAWDWQSLASSLAFYPYPALPANGRMVPLLEAGWTLNYEMLFYALFACLLAGTARETAGRTFLAIAMLVVIGEAFALPPPLEFWTAPILLEFAFGMAIGLWFAAGGRLPAAARAGLVAVALTALIAVDHSAPVSGWSRPVQYGLPMAAIVLAAVSGPLALPRSWLWDLGGNSSYALYLWHLPLLIVGQFVWRHFALPFGPGERAVFMALAILGSFLAAIAVHLVVERPLTGWLKARLLRA